MANTDLIRAVPDLENGASITSNATGWSWSNYSLLSERLARPISVIGLQFQITNVPSVDTTYEYLFDIATGPQGGESTVIQIPYSMRQDTALQYYLTKVVMLPETKTILDGKRLSIRMAFSASSAVTFNGIKVLYMLPAGKVERYVPMPENFKSIKAQGGLSVTERVR